MNDEIIDEELKIMDEQDRDPITLSDKTFQMAIEGLDFRKVVTIDIDASILDVVHLMQSEKIGSILITKDKKLAGIVTERDLLYKVMGKIDSWKDVNVTKIMTADPLKLHLKDKISYVMHNMHVGGYRHLPVVDENGVPVANISIKNINRFILGHFKDSVVNISGTPYRGPAEREGA